MTDNFYVGQKVICINDDEDLAIRDFVYPDCKFIGNLDGLKKGEIYTIRWVGIFKTLTLRPHYCVRLKEIIRPIKFKTKCKNEDDFPYDARRFKPLEEKKTDISIFKKLLVPTPKKKVLEDA